MSGRSVPTPQLHLSNAWAGAGPGGSQMPMGSGHLQPGQMPGQHPFGAPRLEVLEAKVDCITRAIFDLQAEIQGLLRVRKQVGAFQPGAPPASPLSGPPHQAPPYPGQYAMPMPYGDPRLAAGGPSPYAASHGFWGDPR